VSTQTGEYRNVSSRITILSSRMSGFRFARQTEPTAAEGTHVETPSSGTLDVRATRTTVRAEFGVTCMSLSCGIYDI
jgi:hypothetical protein